MAATLVFLAVPATAADPFALTIAGNHGKAILWHHVVATPGDDWINDIVPLGDGRFVAVGFVNRSDDGPAPDWAALALDFEASGKVHRDQRFGEGSGVDALWSMVSGPDGARAFAGFTTRFGAGGIDGLALFTRGDGTMAAERAFGGAGYDRFTSLARRGDGFVFVGHTMDASSDLRRVFMVMTDAAGASLSEHIFDGPGSWGGLYVEPSGDGGYVIAGGVSKAGEDSDMFVIRTDRDGRELWRREVGTADWDEINHGLVVRPDGSIVLVGYGNKRGEEAHDLVAATLTSTGEIVRLERFGGSGDERARLPRLAADGRIWIAGHSDSAGAGSSDALVTVLDSAGAFTGEAMLLGGKAEDIATAVHLLADGTLLLAGYSRNLGSDSDDAFLVRLKWDPIAPLPALKRNVAIPAR
ncbi:MAG: hypothetical protein ABIS23_00985 [Sphingomicrobium sp.]